MTKVTRKLEPFDQNDWDAYAGAEGDARIATFELDGQHYTLITDEVGAEISWHGGIHDNPMDHFVRKDWSVLETDYICADYRALWATSLLDAIEKLNTIEEVIYMAGLIRCQ